MTATGVPPGIIAVLVSTYYQVGNPKPREGAEWPIVTQQVNGSRGMPALFLPALRFPLQPNA